MLFLKVTQRLKFHSIYISTYICQTSRSQKGALNILEMYALSVSLLSEVKISFKKLIIDKIVLLTLPLLLV